MTKFEFLTNCDFNNLKLRDKIIKVLDMLDESYQTLPDETDRENTYKVDEDRTPNELGKYYLPNEKLKKANQELRNTFPSLDTIFSLLKKHNYDPQKTYSELLQIERENIINQITQHK